MSLHLVSLALDANDPVRLAAFWADALGWNVDDSDPSEIRLVPTDGTRFEIIFEPTSEPKVGQNRVHLDLTTASLDDQNQSVEHLVAVGGSHVDIGQTDEEDHFVLADPEGNELCILAPGNNFLAGTKRLGAINSDGLKETGYFWSEALGWPLVWDEGEETAIQSPHGGTKIAWGGASTAPDRTRLRQRLEIDVFAADLTSETDRLVGLGARRIDVGGEGVLLADPDGQPLRLNRAGPAHGPA